MFNVIVLSVMAILAVWKLYDLLIKPAKQSPVEKTEKTLNLFVQFFAEFVYKQAKGNSEYIGAPPSIYGWMVEEYSKWLKERKKNR